MTTVITGTSATTGEIVLNGSTSGTVTLEAPAVAGTTTITLPTSTGVIPVPTSEGTSGQVLTSSGTGAAPTWATPSSLELITSFSMASGTTNVTATGLDLSAYKILDLNIVGLSGTGNVYWYFNANNATTAGYRLYGSFDHRATINLIHGTVEDVQLGGTTITASAQQITQSTDTIYFNLPSGSFSTGTCYLYGIK